jgi:hypothetical protein
LTFLYRRRKIVGMKLRMIPSLFFFALLLQPLHSDEIDGQLDVLQALSPEGDLAERRKAVEAIHQDMGSYIPLALIDAAATELKEGNVEEAATLFTRGLFRAQVDISMSRDKALVPVVSHLSGMIYNVGRGDSKLMKEFLFARVVAMKGVVAWDRTTPRNYDRRWAHHSEFGLTDSEPNYLPEEKLPEVLESLYAAIDLRTGVVKGDRFAEEVLRNPGSYSPPELGLAGSHFSKQGRMEEGAQLLQGGMLRATLDVMLMVDMDEEDLIGIQMNLTEFGLNMAEMIKEISPEARREAAIKAIEGLAAWNEATPFNYDRHWWRGLWSEEPFDNSPNEWEGPDPVAMYCQQLGTRLKG